MIREEITIENGPYLTIGPSRQQDLEVIREVLIERGDPLTLDNARFVLAIGLKNKPLAWSVTPEELPALWAELCPEPELPELCRRVEGLVETEKA